MQDERENPFPADGGLPPPRDEAAALAATGGDAELAQELLAALLRGLPADLERLAASAKAEDWGTLKEIAHRMRGGTSYCAVPALDTALQDLERAVKAGDTPRILSGVGMVEVEAERLQRWLGQ